MTNFMNQYAPQSFDDLSFDKPEVAKRLQQYANGQRTRHLILYGGYGTGKSTIARLICEARLGQSMLHGSVLNAAEITEKDLDTLGRVWSLQQMCVDTVPLAIIEEANLLPLKLQYRLRAIIDRRATMVIFTTNYLHEIEPSLRSRADTVKIEPVSASSVLGTAQWILQKNGVSRSDADVLRLLDGTEGDWRSILEVLEDSVLAIADAEQSVC